MIPSELVPPMSVALLLLTLLPPYHLLLVTQITQLIKKAMGIKRAIHGRLACK